MLSETQFLIKLNERLASSLLFEPGMAFVAMPAGKDGHYVTGFDWTDGKHHRSLFLEVCAEVNSKFTLNESVQVTDLSANHGLNGFIEGDYSRDRDGALFQYTLRFDSGADPKWSVRYWKSGQPPVVVNGSLTANRHAGSALRAAFGAMAEELIEQAADG